MDIRSDYPGVTTARVEVQLSLVWCANNPELADKAVQRFFAEYGGPACTRRFDFSRAGFLTMVANFSSDREIL